MPHEHDRPIDVAPRLDELGDVRLTVGVIARAEMLDVIEATLDVDDDQGCALQLQLRTNSRSRSGECGPVVPEAPASAASS